jgi:hypothetical protein
MAAIYMWRQGEVTVITTTPYPLDATDGMDVVLSFSEGALTDVPVDEVQTYDITAFDGSYTQLRWFYTYGPDTDEVQSTNVTAFDGSYTQLRWFYTYGPDTDEAQTTDISAFDGAYNLKLVEADSPDEEIDISFAFVGGTLT